MSNRSTTRDEITSGETPIGATPDSGTMQNDKAMQKHKPVADMIDLSQYPISDLNQTHSRAFADKCRLEYKNTGLCMLPGFIKPAALEAMASEASAFSDKAYFCKSTHSAYLDDGDDSVSKDDVANRQEHTFVGSVAYDNIPNNSSLKQLYRWDPLKDFIGYVLGKSTFHRFADPFGACSVNVFVEGGEHGWHFDESEYTVTLMLQAPEARLNMYRRFEASKRKKQ